MKIIEIVFSGLVGFAIACDIPGDTLSNSITKGFSIQLQNTSYPDVHNHFLNIWDWGGGDEHLFVSPAGNAMSELTLVDGVITLPWDPIRRAVINGEYEPKDNTTKMFITQRGDLRAIWDVVYGCNSDTDALQTELRSKSRGDIENGGDMGVRPFNGAYDFRWRPSGTSVHLVIHADRLWIKVTLVILPGTVENGVACPQDPWDPTAPQDHYAVSYPRVRWTCAQSALSVHEEGSSAGSTLDAVLEDMLGLRVLRLSQLLSPSPKCIRLYAADSVYREPVALAQESVRGALFPTAGSWNPTMTLCGFAQDLARKLNGIGL
ncbi:hypothetical protein SUNI508_11837 [Seiridium unicorne]|uniref:DUF7909 domain-containing protein n=1 Tax=Seiridium unicorne TaxID=138068 RepID=A0ABR2UG92_9PEZI